MAKLTPDAAMIQALRDEEPAFSDQSRWPDAVLNKALCKAIMETNQKRWGKYEDECGNFRRDGIFAYASHYLSSKYLTQDASDPSNVNPSARLNLSGKSVGDESVQFRVTAIQSTGDDWLSTTWYGTEFIRLRQRAAKGCLAV